jgi:hypothetical protein
LNGGSTDSIPIKDTLNKEEDRVALVFLYQILLTELLQQKTTVAELDSDTLKQCCALQGIQATCVRIRVRVIKATNF